MPTKPSSPLKYLGVGLELAGAVAVFTAAGYFFDRWRGTDPWGTLIGAALGIIGGLYNMVKTAMREFKQ